MLEKIYHGSKNKIKEPVYGKGSLFNDYGQAFYTTQSADLAREWSVDRNRSGFVNCYEIDMDRLCILNLCSQEYTILHWLAILTQNRSFEIQTDFGAEAMKYLKDNFLVDYDSYDVIIGYRADDSYFSFAQDFLNNVISIRTLSRAMYLGELGIQIAVKSERAFNSLKFCGSEMVASTVWYPRKEQRDMSARNRYAEMRKEPWRRGETYMMTIIDEEMKANDARLRPDFAL